MKPFRLLTLALSAGALAALAGASVAQRAPTSAFGLHDGDRVVFYGDSITDQRLYTTYVENYVVTRFPRLNVDFVHSGWGGDRVGGGGGGPIDLRLQRDVIAYKPTVMTIMLGMNDGNYQAFDQKAFDTFSQGYTHILNTVQTALPSLRLTLIQPSPYDDVTRAPKFDGGYNAVLVRYSQFVKDQAAQNKASVADFNTPVVAMLQKAAATDAATAQKIIPDRIHPSPGGHLVMAEALLKAWNAPALVSDVEIDAAQNRVVRAANSQVGQLASGKSLTWTQTDDALPLPPAPNDSATTLALQSSDVTNALDQENLRVTGLAPATHYALTIDGQNVGDFTGAQLADGTNLATLSTPMTRQAATVAGLTTQHNDQHYTRWRTIQVPLMKHSAVVQKALPTLLAALDAEEAQTVAARHAAAQPVPHHYELALAPAP